MPPDHTPDVLLDNALAYVRRGWPVLPVYAPATGGGCTCRHGTACRKTGKHPRPHVYPLSSCLDPATVTRWWTRWPEANIGILTGRAAGLVVIDVDIPAGEADLQRLQARYGPLPATLTARTGSGGRHLYFAHSGGALRTQPLAEFPHLEWKIDGGMVVAAPSLHVSGARYTWTTPPEMAPAALPEWLADLLGSSRQRRA